MSRWDPQPTSAQRWIARHRAGFRVGAVVVIVVAIGGIIYDLATSGLTVGLVLMLLVTIATSINLVNMSGQSARFVEKYDSARDQDPRSE